ncbi:hypothetical protein F5884DRAFT_357181 [Xylogone sp. PMI_703]|nr:hypothetical protein F5884DRAFT_357181 [Xylogone sp. PMI_703]
MSHRCINATAALNIMIDSSIINSQALTGSSCFKLKTAVTHRATMNSLKIISSRYSRGRKEIHVLAKKPHTHDKKSHSSHVTRIMHEYEMHYNHTLAQTIRHASRQARREATVIHRGPKPGTTKFPNKCFPKPSNRTSPTGTNKNRQKIQEEKCRKNSPKFSKGKKKQCKPH